MTDWSGLLERSVAAARPPAFEGVLRRARRRRRRTIVSAGLAVVVVIGGTALAVGSTSTSSHPTPVASPVPGIGQPPRSIVFDGQRLPLLQRQDVHVVLVDSADPTTLRLKLRGVPDQDVLGCGGTAYRAFLLRQDGGTVRVGAYAYGHARACFDDAAPANGLRDLTIPLGVPLGARHVVADGGRSVVQVLDTDTLLRPTFLPKRYALTNEWIDVAAGQIEPFDVQVYSLGSTGRMTLIQGNAPVGTGIEKPDHVESVTVRGRLGALWTQRQIGNARCLVWNEGRTDRLCSTSPAAVSVPQLQAVADGLRSASEAHDQVPVPAVVDDNGEPFQLFSDDPIEVVYAGTRPDQLVVPGGGISTRPECGPITRSFVLSQDSSTVRIGTYAYQHRGNAGGGSCPAPHGDAVLSLRSPLGHRRVIAVTDFNRVVPVIDQKRFLVLAGDQQHTFVGGRDPAAKGYATSQYAPSANVSVTLDEGAIPGVVRVLGPTVDSVTVRGHDADVVRARGGHLPVLCLRWDEGVDDQVQLCLHGAVAHVVLTAGQLVKIARGLHRP